MEEEDSATSSDLQNGTVRNGEDEKEEIKDFVYKHFREVAEHSNGLLLYDPEHCSIQEYVSPPGSRTHCSIQEYVSPPAGSKTDRKAVKKSPCKIQQGAVFSGKILSFGCSVCNDGPTYSPNDLLKHFRRTHKGVLPTYPCDLCGFVTNEFPVLQRHRIEHRNTYVTCEICDNDVQYSLLLLTRHYIMSHSRNGQFLCEKCDFTTLDAGTFVQHTHHHSEARLRCAKCRHVSATKEEHQRHLRLHSGGLPFACPKCDYGTSKSDYLAKHMANVHGEEPDRKTVWRAVEDNLPVNPSAGLKLLLKKNPSLGESKDPQRVSLQDSLSEALQTKNRHFRLERSPDESEPADDRVVAANDKGKNSQELENGAGSDLPNGLTVLMVKNKISLPPNCTTKVMGFKMVDGKKHLVLRVIPSAKSETSAHSKGEDLGSSESEGPSDESNDSANASSDCPTSPCLAGSRWSGSSVHTYPSGTDQQDIMAVKVKVEDEETSIMHEVDVAVNTKPISGGASKASTTADTVSPVETESVPKAGKSHNHNLRSRSSSVSTKLDVKSTSATVNAVVRHDPKVTNAVSLRSELVKNLELPKAAPPRTDENCGNVGQSATADALDVLVDGHKENTSVNAATDDAHSSEKGDSVVNDIKHAGVEENLSKASPNAKTLHNLTDSSQDISSGHRDDSECADADMQNSPNQEVFSFHNYSKETLSMSPCETEHFDNPSELSTDDLGQWSLTLEESPQPAEDAEEHTPGDDDGEEAVNRAAANKRVTVEEDLPENEHPESILQDFNIIKIEEEAIPVSKKQPDSNGSTDERRGSPEREGSPERTCSPERKGRLPERKGGPESKASSSSLGRVVEEHSDAIIIHQLNKDRAGSSIVGTDCLRPTKTKTTPTKTTLRILQMPQGKQQVFLQTGDNQYAVPLQLSGNPGFKLLTKSIGSQINTSTGADNPAGMAVNSGKTDASTPVAGTSQPGMGTTASHYLVNGTGFSGRVLLSNAANSTSADKTTCYLVQRPFPIVQSPSNAGLQLATSPAQFGSRPVLAMPVQSTDKSTGRQAFLVRYISPAKSGTPSSHGGENTGNKVVYKLVTPTGGLLTSGAPNSRGQPVFLTTRPQAKCFLVASNKSNSDLSGVKKFIPVQSAGQKHVKLSCILSPQSKLQVEAKRREGDKPHLGPRPIRPPSQRKRRRKQLFDELQVPTNKSRKLSNNNNKTFAEKEPALPAAPVLMWQPAAKDAARTLRLSPFSPSQQVKYPRRCQPVVVLNHPDADIPEVAGIMRSVNRHGGAVTKVSLSRKTVQALAELGHVAADAAAPSVTKTSSTETSSPHAGAVVLASSTSPRPVQSFVRERYLLRLKLRKKQRRKYEVVKGLSRPTAFECWFCGRLFRRQEDWIGHGQRHLMEATRDWNTLF